MDTKDRLQVVLEGISRAALRAGRDPNSIKLVAVSKTQSESAMRELALALNEAGRSIIFGENYVQEFKKKAAEFSNAEVHFIGSLQRNKAKDAVKLFSCIQSVDSFELAEAVNREAGKISKIQDILLQINISNDSAKGGIPSSETLLLAKKVVTELKNIRLLGLMTITKFYEEAELAREDFRALKKLSRILEDDEIVSKNCPVPLALSMGMSSDYEVAIEEGATIVRVGSAIFGERQKQ